MLDDINRGLSLDELSIFLMMFADDMVLIGKKFLKTYSIALIVSISIAIRGGWKLIAPKEKLLSSENVVL